MSGRELPPSRRLVILDVVWDLAAKFLFYDRKECEELPRGSIEAAVKAGEITVDEIVARFRAGLIKGGIK